MMLRRSSRWIPSRALEKPLELSSSMRPSTVGGMASATRVKPALAQAVLDALDGRAEIQVDGVALELRGGPTCLW